MMVLRTMGSLVELDTNIKPSTLTMVDQIVRVDYCPENNLLEAGDKTILSLVMTIFVKIISKVSPSHLSTIASLCKLPCAMPIKISCLHSYQEQKNKLNEFLHSSCSQKIGQIAQKRYHTY